MKNRKPKSVGSIFSPTLNVTAATVALFLCPGLAALRADPGNDARAPELTGVATNILVPGGNKVCFHAYAVGVQIYVCRNISTNEIPQYAWVFTGPEAVLFADAGANGEIGLHYANEGNPTRPAWETESGSKVVGAVVLPRATPDINAIPWLKLRAVSTEGPGVLARTAYIQRVNTTGGLAPTTGCDAEHLGQEARVAYTAEYYFYRATE